MKDDKEIDEHEEVEEYDEAEMKKHMEIVQDKEEITIDAIPLTTKPPMINIDREDLETLWKLVKAKHGNIRPEDDYERVFWGDLKVMFEPDIKSEVWRSLQGYKVTVWKLFDSCGVDFVVLTSFRGFQEWLMIFFLAAFCLTERVFLIAFWSLRFALTAFWSLRFALIAFWSLRFALIAFCLLKTLYQSKSQRYAAQIATNLAFCLEDLAFCSLRFASRLRFAHCVLSQGCVLLIAFCLKVAFCSLRFVSRLRFAHCVLPQDLTAFCLRLFTAFCLKKTAFCPLKTLVSRSIRASGGI
ncbi:hypothetical protein Tco_0676251 [Tanacetum coccineum]